MSTITDWEPQDSSEPPLNAYDLKVIADYVSTLQPMQHTDAENYWKRCYEKLVTVNQALQADIETLKGHVSTLKTQDLNMTKRLALFLEEEKRLKANFSAIKADSIVTLKAIDLCIIASLSTEKQILTHRARNFRMRHVHQIICNEIASLCDREVTSYEDDF